MKSRKLFLLIKKPVIRIAICFVPLIGCVLATAQTSSSTAEIENLKLIVGRQQRALEQQPAVCPGRAAEKECKEGPLSAVCSTESSLISRWAPFTASSAWSAGSARAATRARLTASTAPAPAAFVGCGGCGPNRGAGTHSQQCPSAGLVSAGPHFPELVCGGRGRGAVTVARPRTLRNIDSIRQERMSVGTL